MMVSQIDPYVRRRQSKWKDAKYKNPLPLFSYRHYESGNAVSIDPQIHILHPP